MGRWTRCRNHGRLRRYRGGAALFTKVSRRILDEGGSAMSIERRIDDLIEAGWGVVASDFDPIAFHHWRRSAFDCLTAMFGPDHVYTKHFAKLVRQGVETDLLAARWHTERSQRTGVLQQAGTGQSQWQRDVCPPD